MKALFIFPKDSILFGVPLGIANLAACLREAGCDIKIIDLRYESEQKLFREINTKDYSIVGIYSASNIVQAVCDFAKKIRQLSPNSFLIVGGPHPTLHPELFLKAGFDIILKGESEKTIVDLYGKIKLIGNKRNSKYYSQLSEVKGIIWRHPSGSIVTNAPQPFIEDLDSLPFPAYDLFPEIQESFKINYTWTNLQPFTHVLTSRGCPYNCTFCQPILYHMFGRKIRRMSAERVFELLSFLKDEYRIREVFFEDDLLFHPSWKKWMFNICDHINENKLDIRWWGQTRANTSTREMLVKAKSAGCYMVMCGCESGSQKVLDYYHKQIKVKETEDLFRICREIGMMTIAEIIFGAPIETMDDAKKTVNLIKRIKPDNVFTTILTVYPGTYLHSQLKKEGVVFEENLSKISRAVPTQKVHSFLTERQIHELQSQIILPNPSLKYILQRPYYREAFKLKVENLIQEKEYAKLRNLLFLTAFDPAIITMRPLYRRYQKIPVIEKIGELYRGIKTKS